MITGKKFNIDDVRAHFSPNTLINSPTGINYIPAYTGTNENLRSIVRATPNCTRVLTTAGSGDQALFYQLAGAQHIDTFDITYCAHLIQDIKTSAIHKMSYDEYISMVKKLPYSTDFDTISHFNEIISELGFEERAFFNIASQHYIFSRGYGIESQHPNAAEFEKLKQTVNGKYNFVWSDLDELHTHLDTFQQYDVINLSNIFDCCFSPAQQLKIFQNLAPHVTKNGHIVYIPQSKDTWRNKSGRIPNTDLVLLPETPRSPQDLNIRLLQKVR